MEETRPTINEREDVSDCTKHVYGLKKDENLGSKLANTGFKAKDAPITKQDGQYYLGLRQCPYRQCPNFVLSVNFDRKDGDIQGLCASTEVANAYVMLM